MESERLIDDGRVAVTHQGHVAHVELARPGKYNAMDGTMFGSIGNTFRALGNDARVRAILLSAQGKHFTAGLDLQYAASQLQPSKDSGRAAESRLRHIRWLQESFSAAEDARVPVVAAVHGGCIGAGVDLVTACDIRLCSADAFFQVAEVDVAITADLGTLQRLTRLIPEGVVRELVYTGRRMEAEEALRLGLVNRVAESREELMTASMELAQAIAAKSPLAVAGAKASLNYSRGRTVEDGLRHVAMWNAATLVSADLEAVLDARRSSTEPEFGPLAD